MRKHKVGAKNSHAYEYGNNLDFSNVDYILNKIDTAYNHEWQLCAYIKVKFISTHKQGFADIYRWWFDRLVEYVSFEIWNKVFSESRKGKYGSNDKESEKLANEAANKFTAEFE